jgi:hypothetical protein
MNFAKDRGWERNHIFQQMRLLSSHKKSARGQPLACGQHTALVSHADREQLRRDGEPHDAAPAAWRWDARTTDLLRRAFLLDRPRLPRRCIFNGSGNIGRHRVCVRERRHTILPRRAQPRAWGVGLLTAAAAFAAFAAFAFAAAAAAALAALAAVAAVFIIVATSAAFIIAADGVVAIDAAAGVIATGTALLLRCWPSVWTGPLAVRTDGSTTTTTTQTHMRPALRLCWPFSLWSGGLAVQVGFVVMVSAASDAASDAASTASAASTATAVAAYEAPSCPAALAPSEMAGGWAAGDAASTASAVAVSTASAASAASAVHH